jgi:hypothetical protein
MHFFIGNRGQNFLELKYILLNNVHETYLLLIVLIPS